MLLKSLFAASLYSSVSSVLSDSSSSSLRAASSATPSRTPNKTPTPFRTPSVIPLPVACGSDPVFIRATSGSISFGTRAKARRLQSDDTDVDDDGNYLPIIAPSSIPGPGPYLPGGTGINELICNWVIDAGAGAHLQLTWQYSNIDRSVPRTSQKQMEQCSQQSL